ncbi:MAG: phosphatidylserine decarboxylase [Myxococcota bacterium]
MPVPRELRSPIVPQAFPVSAALGALALLTLLPGWGGAAAVLLGLAVAHLAFFRNPSRRIPPGEGRVLAPADGRVVEVVKLDDPDGFVGPAWRVAIFLSIFDVHVNRAPLSGVVRARRERGAGYQAAFRAEASERNVQLRLDLETSNGVRAAVVQITGLVARRIVCYPDVGGRLVRGEPYGLICYGSRVEVSLPVTAEIRVRRGDRVRAGETVIAEIDT